MRWRAPVLLAVVLLLSAAAVDLAHWWRQNELEALEAVRRTPVAGDALGRALGYDRSRPAITIAVDASYPPFASVDAEDRLIGFEVDLAGELGRRLADQGTVVNMDTGDGVIDALVARRIDAIIAGLTPTPESRREVALSLPYYDAGPVLVIGLERRDIRHARDLAGKRVAVEAGSLGEEESQRLAREVHGMALLDMSDAQRVLDAVVEGSADAAVLDRPSMPIGSPFMERVRVLEQPLVPRPYTIAVRRWDHALLLAINRELESLKAEGMLAEMERRWFK